jgi:hypothetical protein
MTKRKEVTPVKSYAPNGNGASPFQVEIKIDALTWDDLYVIMAIDKDAEFTRELVTDLRSLFERVVVGGAAAVPVIYTKAVMEQIGEAMKVMGEPKNSAPA